MVPRNHKDIIKKLDLSSTYLTEDDLVQEALIASLFSVQSVDEMKRHLEDQIHLSIRNEELIGLPDTFSELPLDRFCESVDPIEKIIKKEQTEKAIRIAIVLIDRCPPRSRMVIRLMYGLVDGICHTAKEIARRFKVSVRIIRQLEREALLIIRGGKSLIRR